MWNTVRSLGNVPLRSENTERQHGGTTHYDQENRKTREKEGEELCHHGQSCDRLGFSRRPLSYTITIPPPVTNIIKY